MLHALLPLLAGVALSIPAQPTQAERRLGFLDAGHLSQLCVGDPAQSTVAMSICLGYVVGAADQMLLPGDRREPAVCFPHDMTAADIVAAVLTYEPTVDGEEDVAAADYLRHVFAAAYPCPTTGAAPG